ncbi:MAG: ADP-ribosylglycohydrolase family protein [Candidatus Heimdallarchaeota archaeon]|nr:ADP-ribosylglycohydrolase family protein [Candidatus Heimdallarchaeota archaeon]
MLGAIIGDYVGSRFEANNHRSKEFLMIHPHCRITDDTVLTIAVAQALLTDLDYAKHIRIFGNNYPRAGYGGNLIRWLMDDTMGPYNSWGNGSAMRVSPVAYAYDTLEKVESEAKKSAVVTHNHPEGIKGAQAVAAAVFTARTGSSKNSIEDYISEKFGYDLDFDLVDLQISYTFDVSCQGSVPQAIFCFLISTDFEDAIRNAISIGGDSDTIACITGAIAEAYYGTIPQEIQEHVIKELPRDLLDIYRAFVSKYRNNLVI